MKGTPKKQVSSTRMRIRQCVAPNKRLELTEGPTAIFKHV
jgi:hypothetical protein